jgi:hypothetical protein
MSSQLDILALEPFFGGVRRAMLEALIRCSRHRWTLLKLPPRRIERRLAAAAPWFAEQLSRHWVGRVDLVFTSEALNLADLYQKMPTLARKPAVVYFHENQLPDPWSDRSGRNDLVNLSTASASREIWFNSRFHLNDFLKRAGAMVDRHPELLAQNPMAALQAKSQLLPPPLSLNVLHEIQQAEKIARDRRTMFVETRDADTHLLNNALAKLKRRGERFHLITVGPVEDLAPDLDRSTVLESDDGAQARALLRAGTFVSAKPGAPFDYHAVRALAAGCWPVLPSHGVYTELVPQMIAGQALYDSSPDVLASRLQDSFRPGRPDEHEEELKRILQQFNPLSASHAMDQRFEELVTGRAAPKPVAQPS